MILVSSVCFVVSPCHAQVVVTVTPLAPHNTASDPVITGLVTDACSGAIVVGAKITVGSGASAAITYSGSMGTYLLTLPLVGYQPFVISKTGYDSFSGTVLLSFNTTTTQNAALLCTPVPPENVTAVLDNPVNPISVNLTWSQPQGNYQLVYDDGSQESYSVWAAAGNMHALRFTPLGWPAKVTGGIINIGESSNYLAGALPLNKFKMFVFKADGPGGVPGTPVDSMEVTPASFGWINFTFAAPVTINSGDFYLVMQQEGIPPHACGIGIDTTTPQLRSWSRFVSGSGPWVPVAGNYMMRAVVKGTGGPVMTDEATFTPSYHVWRLIQGQETNPAQWTSVYTGNLTSWTDYAWPMMQCNPYRWAVKAVFPPGQRVSAPAFSNVLGKCWTSTVTIQTTTDCGLCGKNVPVLLTNNLYPDTNYRIPLDSLGHGQLSGIWKGNYHLTFAQFTCELVVMNNVPVFGDTTITFNVAGVKPPPTDLSINEQSLVATWNAPRVNIDLFNETWSSGTFTFNQWVVTGGNNWQISSTLGFPAPSAMFSWTPQCTNCSQYLTSKTLLGYVAPSVVLKYDVYLDNYSATSLNTLAVEIWNGTTWSVLKTYDNQGGSIPWTSEVFDITNVASHDFKIRFHASSQDTYSINSWNVDNIRVVARDHPTPPECLLGYTFYLNNTQAFFTYDTTVQIPPQQVIYGHKYQACVRAVYTGGYSAAICDSFTCKYLYPPKNLSVTPIECAALLTWEKPDDPVALSALMGYDIYRSGTFIHYNNHPDSVSYDDLNLNPGSYLYRVRCKYDLGIYGFPGQVGESLFLSDTGAVTVQCGFPIPFHEGWDQGNFSFHSWTFQPDQGNWGISTFIKSNAPFADFHWQPVRTNYSYAMESDAIDASGWKCAKLWLDFDYKLTDHNSTGNEKLKVEAWYDNGWHLMKTLSNTGSVDWTTLHLDLSAASGKGLKIRFVAYGVNSGDILHWYVDNINVYGVCLPPSALTYTMSGQMVNLTWTAPACNNTQGPAGYNVYRTDSTGLPPFILRNQALISGTSYSDDTGPGVGGMYYYFVTAVFNDPVALVRLCESAGTDTIVISTVGTSEKINRGPWVFPNPATGSIRVKSDRKIVFLEMLDYSGTILLMLHKPDAFSINLDVSVYPSGIYFMRVTDQQATKIIKVVVSH